jgi:hypothetical protein
MALVLLAACAGTKPAPHSSPAPTTQPSVVTEAGEAEAGEATSELVTRSGDAVELMDGGEPVDGGGTDAPGLHATAPGVGLRGCLGLRVDRRRVFTPPTFPPSVGRAAQDLPRVR